LKGAICIVTEGSKLKNARWEHFPHDADVGVRGFGPTKESAFEGAALAMTAVMANPQAIHAEQAVHVTCEAPDDELLLAEWLNAVVFESAHRKMLFSRFEVRMAGHQLFGKMWGEKVDVNRHQPAVEVKGATYTELAVRSEGDGWMAQCVVDV
jgi:tRNA nucleotidyltransferase (CCA-adding enzyme)